MKPIKLIIFVLALSGSECRSEIIEEKSDGDQSAKLMEAAVITMLSCFEEKVVGTSSTVGAAGISEPILLEILLSKQSLPVILIHDDTARAAVTNQPVDERSRHRLQLFVVEVTSSHQLDQIFQRAKNSKWWNHMATYLIIDWPSQKGQEGCSNAFKYLSTAWNMSLLNAFYVCFDKLKEKALVYTYNPYTSRAPVPWRLEKTYKGKNDHPWSLFVQEYRPGNQDICDNLNFAKTHDLGGYDIRCFLETHLPSSKWTTQNAQKLFRRKIFPEYILKALNATPDLYLFGGRQPFNQLTSWNPRRNITIKSLNGEIFEILFDFANNLEVINFPTSNRVLPGALKVLTQYKGEMSILDKFIAVLDRSTRIGLCLVALKTLLFFKYFMRQPLGSAILNVIRIIANSSLVKVPKKVAPRLYLAGVFFLVVTIVGIYQGKIASLLTKPTPLPDVETMKDLANSPHTIYGNEKHAKFFMDPRFNGRYVGLRSHDCHEHVVRDPLAACVGNGISLTGRALILKLHVSRNVIVPMDLVYLIQSNWPLEKRLNEIIASFTESHIIWYNSERHIEYGLEDAKYKAMLEKDRPIPIKLSDLGFAFAILGIGLGLATVAFIFEVAIKRA